MPLAGTSSFLRSCWSPLMRPVGRSSSSCAWNSTRVCSSSRVLALLAVRSDTFSLPSLPGRWWHTIVRGRFSISISVSKSAVRSKLWDVQGFFFLYRNQVWWIDYIYTFWNTSLSASESLLNYKYQLSGWTYARLGPIYGFVYSKTNRQYVEWKSFFSLFRRGHGHRPSPLTYAMFG